MPQQFHSIIYFKVENNRKYLFANRVKLKILPNYLCRIIYMKMQKYGKNGFEYLINLQ